MKIEYIKEGSEDCPLIRIYGDEPESIKLLMAKVTSLINGDVTQILVNNIDTFSEINQCYLAFVTDSESKGVLLIKNNSFKCILTKNDWETVYNLMKPLSKTSAVGYQWLDEKSEIS